MRKPMPASGVFSVLRGNFEDATMTLADVLFAANYLNPKVKVKFYLDGQDIPLPVDNVLLYNILFFDLVVSPVIEDNDTIDVIVEPK
jgi:hypothetical protein